ncbi:otoferlin-like isoform X8 [Mizuhopecten yessoensis]|uniref:otoferlin-like isoform X8 n=1 Tax=Mizuhopecten yessoensis TaxID=6573 RepID=UPI000B458726|nr:otoferlin-like isoform X8 [Mizuhopecten yessoensis]
MALILHLKYAENLRGRADRLAKVSFRGVCHYSKIIENAEDSIWFDESFEWPVARPVEKEEIIDIQVFNYNKYLSNRLIGTFRMILQELVDVGHVKISDSLLDGNNVVMRTTMTFELTYNAPDGSVGLWQKGEFKQLKSDELRVPLTEEERNQLNLGSRSSFGDTDSILTSPSKASLRESRLSLASKTSRTSGGRSPKHVKNFPSVVKMMMGSGKRSDVDEKQSLIDEIETDPSLDARAAEVASMLGARAEQLDDDQGSQSSAIATPVTNRRNKGRSQQMEPASLKAQDFQVCITVIEARQLAGLNMDPVVCVQVGDQKKYTSVKESTNCPYYSEYFVFDFHMAPAMLFDRIITLTVCQSGRLFRSNKPLGTYKLDVGTVYNAQDRQFYHKWAMLTDSDDINGGVKGYVKVDIAVIGKGDSVKVPPKTDKDEDDIEGNLLLPEGVPADRQRAKFTVRVLKAEGLPKMNTGIMANVKKAFTGETKDLVDPYVSVSFAGHVGKTSVKKGCYEPVWNEQLVFTEMFPPLCRRMKVQLRDSDKVNDDIIGTFFIDISKISNEGDKGFLPTFGPCWINLYGSIRDYSLLDENTHLNDGLGEGVSYRGRMLISLKTDIIDSVEEGSNKAMVELEPALPLPENATGRVEEYFLFGCFLEASMIDKKVGDKPVRFEISIANAGNTLDGYNPPTKKKQDSSSEEEDSEEEGEDGPMEKLSTDSPKWQSHTPPLRPVTRDRCYYHLPFYDDKPCVYIKEVFEDHRRRMYNTNIINKIVEKLEDGINDVHEMINQEQPFPEKRLRGVFEELGSSASKFVTIVKGTSGGATAGKTKLDKERQKLLIREMDQMSTLARSMKATVSKGNLKDKIRYASQYLQRLKGLTSEPQHALPDVFIWMVSGNKRIAYQRIPAMDIIYSIVDEERGKDCSRVQTLLLKLPGKKATSQAGWAIQAKVQVYLWLGLAKHKKDFLNGLPGGYETNKLIQLAIKPQGIPPPFIHYTEKQLFQLRAHLYQARSLIGSDASGLSDPFARIAFGDQSVCTQVIEETLSPTWDEMLIINEVTMFGLMEEIANSPPTIIVELFDQDKVGKSEFIGRSITKPLVKKSNEKYEMPKFPPRLEWWDIRRGPDRAGELLATFELLQFPFEEADLREAHLTPPHARKIKLLAAFGDMSGQDLPPLQLPAASDKDRGPIMPVPKGIRPVLSKHRIEILFWGVRDLKRVQLTSVDKPRIDVECAGQVLQSSIIQTCKKNPNFNVPVKFFDVELPENELYCPPITIRCVDCRNFGRYVLVGTHVINSLHKFMYVPTTKKAKSIISKLFPGKDPDAPKIISEGHVSVKADDVAVTIDERLPLVHKEPSRVNIDLAAEKKEKKTAENKKRKKSSADDEDDLDLESLDWWSKYFASVDTLIMDEEDDNVEVKVIRDQYYEQFEEHDRARADGVDPLDLDNKEEVASSQQQQQTLQNGQGNGTNYGTIPNGQDTGHDDDDPDFNAKEAKKFEAALKKMEKQDAKGDKKSKGSSLASKLSPKSQRKKEKATNSTAQLKTISSGLLSSNFHTFVNKAFQSDKDDTIKCEEEKPRCTLLKVFPCELESLNDFSNFKDWLHTFELYRGKKTGNDDTDESRVVGKFKGSLKIYKIPLPDDIEDTTVTGGDPSLGLFQGLPGNDPIKVLVRVYVVKANDLHPADMNGKADPYLVIRLGQTTINDKENYLSKQLNPVFGKCVEIEATFPMESLLTVQVYDWDLVGMDDLIGETQLDLENRYYSRHRGTCGFTAKYDVQGYNMWRDPMKPTQILAKLCKEGKVDGPHYQPGKVRIANRIFTASMDQDFDNDNKAREEHLALYVLKHWEEIPKVGRKLVPEHVETRPLYNPEKPGIEQGKVEMWVDMFPMDMPAPGPPVDISPRKPKSYELRCIIWNTDDVVLEDDAFFTGEKMSDIYVKGWIKGQEDMQNTDIHYRSLTGEGNFNWRFVYPFEYLIAEEKIVISRKESLFSWDESETKIPARLNLQVWDADHFSADDFLGALTLDLNRFPRGAKSAKLCSLDMLKTDGSVPQMSLFKQKRVKGWWPFAVKSDGEDEYELTGKVEAELHLLSTDEAEKHPAGLGRNEPDPLEKPNRPDSSFIWFLNPLKSIRYILCHNYKWVIIKVLIVLALAAILVLFFYAMPGYMVKRMFGA